MRNQIKNSFIFLAFFPVVVLGQEIHWGDTVLEVSSQKSVKQHAAKQVLGAPDAMPQGGSNPCAWSPRKKSGYSKIKVRVEKVIGAKQVVISENYNAGCIYRVYVFDSEGKRHQLAEYEGRDDYPDQKILHVPIEKNISVAAVQLYLVGTRRNGWPEIDAIGITNSSASYSPEIPLSTSTKDYRQIQNLGKKVNSEYDEVNPVITPDHGRLYFVRKKHSGNTGGKDGGDDIWYSKRQLDESWGNATNIGSPLNTLGPNSVCGILPGQNTIAVRDNYSDKPDRKKNICLSEKRPTGWGTPVPQNIENFYNRNEKSSFFLCSDGVTLLMAIERNDSYGGLDLYVSFKKGDNRWSEPQNLGSGVNTAADEITPFLASDGRTLYFSTKGFRGYGNNDIFMTRKKEEWNHWSTPINLGEPLNSEAWDAYLNLPASGQYGYFVSYRNTMNMADVFRVRLPQTIKPAPVTMVEGKIKEVSTEQSSNASVINDRTITNLDIPLHQDAFDKGKYKMIVPKHQKQTELLSYNKNYIATAKTVNSAELDSFQKVERDIYLNPIKVGQTITLNNIFFEFNKAKLKSASFDELRKVYNLLSDNPEMKIEVAGHTDSVGDESYNKRLSLDRARSVKSFLVNKGIDKNRILTTGYGESKPVATNKTEKGRERNRRVTFTITEK